MELSQKEKQNILSRPNFSPGSGLTVGIHLAELSLKINKTKSQLYCWDNEKCHKAVACVFIDTIFAVLQLVYDSL